MRSICRKLKALLLVGIIASAAVGGCGPANEDVMLWKVRIYRGGTGLCVETADADTLERLVRGLLETADNGLWEAVTPERIQEIKRRDSCVEVVYRQPRETTVALDGKVITFDRVLIPLDGLYVYDGGAVAVFWGNGSYEGFPLLNSAGVSALTKALSRLESFKP
ncbi:MAG: hypothetical protein GF344_08765 [Chitinivibrionales bacterium]|nr:hypothetical protein [Chitinivibrionales bacterium]